MSLNLDKSGWKHVTFGDVVRRVNESVRDPEAAGIDRIVAMEHMDPGEIKIERWGSVADGTSFSRRVRPGQTLFGKRRAYQRKVAYAEFDAICSGDILTFEADPSQLLPELLPFLAQSEPFFDHALGTSAGSLSPRTNWRDLSTFEFDLPPLDEQQRITNLLWAIEQHKLALATVANQLDLSASTLIARLKRSWADVKHLRDVATVHNGQNFPKLMQGRSEGGVPFFKVADLDHPGNERYLTNPGNWVSEADVQVLGAELLAPGTIVTARVGAAIRLERRRSLIFPALVDENHLVIKPIDVDPAYLFAILSETRLAQAMNGGVVPSLNQKIIGNIQLPSVSREREQNIGRMYSRLHDAHDLLAVELQALTAVRSAILEGIFGGNDAAV